MNKGVFLLNKQRLLEEFLELVKIDSETKNERQIADVLTEKLAALGFSVTEDDSSSKTGHGAGNLIAELEGTVQADPIFFTCSACRKRRFCVQRWHDDFRRGR